MTESNYDRNQLISQILTLRSLLIPLTGMIDHVTFIWDNQ